MFQCLSGLYNALFDKVQEKENAKYHPLTRFALWRSLVIISNDMVATTDISCSYDERRSTGSSCLVAAN